MKVDVAVVMYKYHKLFALGGSAGLTNEEPNQIPLESNQELQPLFDSPDMFFVRLGLYEFIRSRTLDLVFDNWSDLSEGNGWLPPGSTTYYIPISWTISMSII